MYGDDFDHQHRAVNRMLDRASDPSTTLTITTLATLLLVFGAIFAVPCVNVWNETMERYDVTGTVQAVPTSRMRISGDAQRVRGAEKYAIFLEDRIVNCSSTQCGALVPGQRVVLSCYSEWHLWTPDEVECRFAGLMAWTTP
jgi:hypothetical protein